MCKIAGMTDKEVICHKLSDDRTVVEREDGKFQIEHTTPLLSTYQPGKTYKFTYPGGEITGTFRCNLYDTRERKDIHVFAKA